MELERCCMGSCVIDGNLSKEIGLIWDIPNRMQLQEEGQLMAEDNKQPSKPNYTMGYSEAEQQRLSLSAAANNAVYLLPYLTPGMRLLDIGCGPGLISVALVAAVAPGELLRRGPLSRFFDAYPRHNGYSCRDKESFKAVENSRNGGKSQLFGRISQGHS